jgi:cell division protein FtsI (penicillin-binding protein 3)
MISATVPTAARTRNAPAGQRQHNVALTHFRLMLVMLLFIGVIAVIGGRLALLAAFGETAGAAGAGNGLMPDRGDLVDRNGYPLARTIQAWSIAIHPRKLLSDPEDLAPKLAQLMPERSEAQYLAMLRSGKSFSYLRRRAMPELVAQVNALGEPGIALAREPERLYPQTSLAGAVLGWTDIDGHGVTGMERVLDKQLVAPETRGTPIALSIDSRVQASMESELYAAMNKFQAIGATGIVLDVNTGEVIALASLPTFNPNAPGKATPDARFNKATMGVYELGSTFKPITVATAMDAGVVTSMSKRYDATQPLQVGRFKISDFHAQKRFLNVPEMLVHSSNIVTARIADEVGPARMQGVFRKLGFDSPADIEIEKGHPLWPKFWARTTTMTTAYGHGIAVTPLHLAAAYAALVNGGVWRPATLLKRGASDAPAGRRIWSEATSRQMRRLLRLVATEGTGRKGDAPGLRVGGKTGTADKSMAGGYSRSAKVSTFAAAFPMDAPRFVVIAMLDEPKGTADTYGYATAAWTAAPVVAKVISRTGPLLGIQPDESKDMDLSDLKSLLWSPKNTVPE